MTGMADAVETEVRIDGTMGALRGKILRPRDAEPMAALVLAHGRTGDMDEPLVASLARRGAEIGLWTLRFTFAFRERNADPSEGIEDEIEDLRVAIAFARRESGVDRVVVAGRGLGAWAVVAASTDEDAEDAILLGPTYTGQVERRMALERLHEFEIATLIVVGGDSDRADIGALRELVAPMPTVQLEVIEGADHRLMDASGRVLTGLVIPRCEAWLRARTA